MPPEYRRSGRLGGLPVASASEWQVSSVLSRPDKKGQPQCHRGRAAALASVDWCGSVSKEANRPQRAILSKLQAGRLLACQRPLAAPVPGNDVYRSP